MTKATLPWEKLSSLVWTGNGTKHHRYVSVSNTTTVTCSACMSQTYTYTHSLRAGFSIAVKHCNLIPKVEKEKVDHTILSKFVLAIHNLFLTACDHLT